MWCCMEKERLTKVPIGCLKNKRREEYTRSGKNVKMKICLLSTTFMNVHYYYYYYYHRSI